MLIQKINPSQLSKAYNIWCQGLYPVEAERTYFPFGSTYCEIEPSGFSAEHRHHENETFLILEGSGVMEISGEKAEVGAGSVILIPAKSAHRLDNTSSSERLKFVSIYWTAPLIAPLPKELIVIPAPPTPNGPLHLGHLSGPYLASDVFTRYASLRGSRAFYGMGTDDNQCYVLAKGRQLNLTGEEVTARYVPLIMGALEKFGCKVHSALHPLGMEAYTKLVQQTFVNLVERRVLELRKVPTPFCEDTKQFLYGAQVSGGCPHCGEITNGNGCEKCGYYNDCSDLINPKSNVGDGPITIKEAEKYYFPLSKYGNDLVAIINQIAMHPKLRSFYLRYIEEGLPDIAVSQFGTWGIPCPHRPGQVLYEWFEMAGSYLYLAGEVEKQNGIASFWRAEESGVVEAFGFDNSFFYGLLLPALMKEIDPSVKPPRAFLWNYFFHLEGKKFSTSRGHAIWADDILATVPPDVLRFYLCLNRSEDKETNFQIDECESFVSSELVSRWESFLKDLNVDLETTQRTVPAYQGSVSEDHERFLSRVNSLIHEVHENYSLEHFSLNRAAASLSDLLSTISGHFYRTREKVSSPNSLNVTLQSLSAWANLLSPMMPTFSGTIIEALSAESARGPVKQKMSSMSVGKLPLAELSLSLLKLNDFKKKSREKI